MTIWGYRVKMVAYRNKPQLKEIYMAITSSVGFLEAVQDHAHYQERNDQALTKAGEFTTMSPCHTSTTNG